MPKARVAAAPIDAPVKTKSGIVGRPAPAPRHKPLSTASGIDVLDLAAATTAVLAVAAVILRQMPPAYMDEPFHLGQTQRYCKGAWSTWDPKITTFPGLYLAGVAYAKAVWQVISLWTDTTQVEVCQLPVLRSLNAVSAAACFAIASKLYEALHPAVARGYCLSMGALLTLFPLHFFFILLYYTDVGSATFVLLSYLLTLKSHHHWSALAAAAAVLFRQTNAVWAACILVAAVAQRSFRHDRVKWRDAKLETQIKHIALYCWQRKLSLLRDMWSLALVPLAFAGFVLWNGGIVVGDKANHEPAVHFMQPLYFVLFSAVALGPLHFGYKRMEMALRWLLLGFQQRPLTMLRLLGTALILAHYVVAKYTLVHPFLLSDNRHFAFYIWKDIMNARPISRHLFVPLYLYSGWSIWESLRSSRQLGVFMTAAMLSTLVTLIPAKLVEFRYFTIPFMMLVLHMKPPAAWQVFLIILQYIIVNAATLWIFLYWTRTGTDGEVIRFMW